jgi:hypothetical protein
MSVGWVETSIGLFEMVVLVFNIVPYTVATGQVIRYKVHAPAFIRGLGSGHVKTLLTAYETQLWAPGMHRRTFLGV